MQLYYYAFTILGGEDHSTVLLVLAFCLAAVDTTSSATFLPFLAHFKPSYMTAFYVGEGMSGLLPTAIAFIQGSGEYTCVSKSVNGSDDSALQPEYADLLFTVTDFFLILFGMLVMSLIAFAMLSFTSVGESERIDSEDSGSTSDSKSMDLAELSGIKMSVSDSSSPIVTEKPESRANEETLSTGKYLTLLIIMAVVSGLGFGVLPTVQIYSLLPYGQIYYR